MRKLIALLLFVAIPCILHATIVTRYFSVGLPTSGSLSLVYVVTANTITRASGSFVTDGFSNGDTISVQGTASNNGVFTIASVSALVITTNEALANETVTSIINKGDGSTWSLRTNLFSGGAWSGRLTLFSFAGSDSLVVMIGPGTHTVTVAMASGLFANPPTAANPLIFHGCDSSGVALEPPDKDWVSAQPAWDASGLPVIATTSNIATSSLSSAAWRLIRFTASGRTGGAVITGSLALDWFVIDQSTANTAACGLDAPIRAQNGVINMTGSSYNYGVSTVTALLIDNTRIVGVTGSSGDRRGVEHTATTAVVFLERCTIISHGGAGIASASSNVGQLFMVSQSVIANNQGTGIETAATASQTALHQFRNNMITGNGASGTGYGIDAQSAGMVLALTNRLRDNDDGNINGLGNYPTDLGTYTTDSDDASEYVNSAGGDFRIKSTATIVGMGFGVADQAGGGQRSYSN